MNQVATVPFVDLWAQYLSIRPQIDGAIESVLRKTAFIGGEFVDAFEQDFAAFYGVKHCISCANGTDSLFIIMKMLGIGHGDEVITPANSWISSSETISLTGATPVFVDVDERYYSMDESLVESRIGPRTKAVMAVHLQGQMCAIAQLRQICERHKIHLIEDCAQSHLSRFGETRAGLFGCAGSFSFYPGKNLGAYGDAGCIITNDDDLALRCRRYARHGALVKHQHDIEGINSRMDGLQAAILSAKLPHLSRWTEERIRCSEHYRQLLANVEEVTLPEIRPGTTHTFHLFVVRSSRRDELAKHLRERGVETAIHYPTPLPFLEAYRSMGHKPSDFPVCFALRSEILSLPLFPELTEEQIGHTVSAVKAFYAQGVLR